MITLILGIALIVIGIVNWIGLFNITTLSLFGCVVSALLFVIFDLLKEVTKEKKGSLVYILGQILVVVSLVIFPYITKKWEQLIKANDALSLIGLGLVIITIAIRERNFFTTFISKLTDIPKSVSNYYSQKLKEGLQQMEKLDKTWRERIKELEELHEQQIQKIENNYDEKIRGLEEKIKELEENEINSRDKEGEKE